MRGGTYVRFLERLASFARVTRFDKRGTLSRSAPSGPNVLGGRGDLLQDVGDHLDTESGLRGNAELAILHHERPRDVAVVIAL
jgi:hypothetical protein